MTTEQLNLRCTGVKRLLKEAAELRHANEMFCARPIEDNLFEWHFSVRGPPDSPYAGGIYHGRIVLPADYPMKPPNLILLTPNGRFETNKKICLSISGYHPETWLPSWSIRTALLALIGFMPTHSAGALGGLECSREERRRLAIKSLDWRCETCGVVMRNALPPAGSTENGQTERLLKEICSASGNKTETTSTAADGHDQIKSLPAPMFSSSSDSAIASSTSSSNASASFPPPPPQALLSPAHKNTLDNNCASTTQSHHDRQQLPLNSSTTVTTAGATAVSAFASVSAATTSAAVATAAGTTITQPQQQQNARRRPSPSPSVVHRRHTNTSATATTTTNNDNSNSTMLPLVCIGLLALLLFMLVVRRFLSSSANGVSSTRHSSPFSSSAGGGHLSL